MKLSHYLQKTDQSDVEFARRVDVTQQCVNRWRRGLRTPTPDQMRKIIRVTDGAVMPNDFYLDGEDTAA